MSNHLARIAGLVVAAGLLASACGGSVSVETRTVEVGVGGSGEPSADNNAPSSEAGATASDAGATLAGASFDLADYAGQDVLLWFYAPW